MITAILVVAILVSLIIAHEFGHFVVAKVLGVRVEEFGIGYPPRAFRLGAIGETEYTINWLPFGGFVRLFGEDAETGRAPRSLSGASRGVQAAILVAGVSMNVLVAWALFTGAFMAGVPRPVDSSPEQSAALVASSVVPASPANAAGIQTGDRIISVRDASGKTPKALTPEGVLAFVEDRGGSELFVTYERADVSHDVVVRPAHGVLAEAAGRPAIGVGLVLISSEPLSFGAAASAAAYETKDAFVAVARGLWQIIARTFEGTGALRDIVGPVGLAGVVGEAARHGLGDILALAAFISINLAVINLIPIPALDGGRLFFLAIETVARRPVPAAVQQLTNALGFVLVIGLMLAVTYQDIAHLLA